MLARLILFALAFGTLVSCTTLKVPNVPIYADKGKLGAIRVYTIGNEERQQIPKFEWDRLRVGMFCMDAKALGDYQLFVEVVCQKNQNCIAGVRRVLDNLEGK